MTTISNKGSAVALTIAATAAVGVLSFWAYNKATEIEDAATYPIARIFHSKDDASKDVCEFIVELAQDSIDKRGVFHLSVAGGSLLDLLTKLQEYKNDVDWSKVTLSFANHKCVLPTSEKANMAKAKKKFADELGITNIVAPTSKPVEGSDGTEEAKFYAKALVDADIPHTQQFPILDLVLLGLGADGHVGSCHPKGTAVRNNKDAVAGSKKTGEPSSITLTISAMNHARQVAVIVCGGSKGKKEAVVRALRRPAERPCGIFPAQLLTSPTFFLDAEAAEGL